MSHSRRSCRAWLQLAVLFGFLRLVASFPPASRLGDRSHRRGLLQRSARVRRSRGPEREGDGARYTVSYSPNFQRHIVRSATGGEIAKSFWWLEDALREYPGAVPQPLQLVDDAAATSTALGDVAGRIPGTSPRYGYPSHAARVNGTANAAAVRDYLTASLGLHRRQVDEIPGVFDAPAAVLRERIEFLLAPLPPALRNATAAAALAAAADTDWPLEFERRGAGAGLSAVQVAAALRTLPQKLLPPPPPVPRLVSPVVPPAPEAAPSPDGRAALLSYLYQSTPSAVLQMARSQLDPLITGTTSLCTAAFAHLHWTGWEWRNCCVMIQALPSVLTTSLEPSWEVKRNGMIRPSAAEYLQWRLQLRAWQIHAMIRTHPMLMGYSESLLQRQVDGLQSQLEITTAEIQRIVLLHPSLLGMSSEALQSQISFWTESVGLSLAQLTATIMRMPALLQYSVEDNLERKLRLFRQRLRLDDESIADITCKRPKVWGRSLNRHYEPLIDGFHERLALDGLELGRILARVPELLHYSWHGTLLPRLDYIQARLKLQDADLKALIQYTPQVLTHSIERSLEPKIRLLEASTSEVEHVRRIVLTNPSLALVPIKSLQERLEKTSQHSRAMMTDNVTRSAYLVQRLGRARGKAGRSRKVWLIRHSEGEEETPPIEFESVAEGATFCGLSRSRLYNVIRKGLSVKIAGERFHVMYADVLGDKNAAPNHMTANQTITNREAASMEPEPIAALFIDTTGRAYPSEETIRGRRRAGGMALQIHLSGTNTDVGFWRKIVETGWEHQRFRLLGNKDSVLVLLGYSYTRPSRPRCSLYVIREALRLAREWVRQTPGQKHRVFLRTDLNYVAFLLREDLLNEWSACENLAAFVRQYQGPTDLVYQANPDILHPLARTYRHLLLKEVPVTIEAYSRMDPRLGQGALMAAKRMYASI